MKVQIVGAGPGGLYLAVLLRSSGVPFEVTVVERNGPDDTFGWGVVFSDETLETLRAADSESHDEIARRFARWDAIDVHVGGPPATVLRSRGHGFAGIARVELLHVLQRRAAALGAEIQFRREVEDPVRFARDADADVIVAADGVNSRFRAAFADSFRPSLAHGRSKYIWLGTRQPFPAFTFVVREHEAGTFQVHAYRYDDATSTFIVETDEQTWRRAGFDRRPVEESVAECEKLFAPELGGHELMTNRSTWIDFVTVRNERWHDGRVVLLGDAAHTAHFSIGSGTKLAMEDAIALAGALTKSPEDVPSALDWFEKDRRLVVAKTQRAAAASQAWFEEIGRYADFEPLQLAFSLLTRSKKVTHANLAVRDHEFVASVDRRYADRNDAAGVTPPPPPMFTPLRLRGMELRNRIVVSPMCTYSAEDGTPGDWHLVHLGSRALGGAGLLMTEMTDVSREGRITPGCAGMYLPEHVAAWARIVDFVHASSDAKIGMQLAHAGRKGSTRLMWEGIDRPLPTGNWPLLAPSPIPYLPESQVPREMTRADMDAVRDDFVRAARRADEAGFDLLELHFAHGYLLASFLSPLTNVRTDEHGGNLENRMRWPLEVFSAVREAWPAAKPLAVRLSATDWLPGGTTPDDAVVLARALAARGCDVADVSSGMTVPGSRPDIYGRTYQVPFSDRIRNEVKLPTMTVGNVTTWDQANTILAAGRADLVVLARAHLADPYFTLHAAAEQGWSGVRWPAQYLAAWPQPASVLTD